MKNRDIRDIALASLGLNLQSEQKKIFLKEISSVNKKHWYRCEFRNCDLLLIYGGDNVLEKSEIRWTEAANQCPQLKQWIDDFIDPYFTIKPRIIILKTSSTEELNWHIDCNKEEINTFQPKLRCLISGKNDDLFYLTKSQTKLPVQIKSDVYFMSGAYIHSLKNTSEGDRYVLCFGSPWNEAHLKPKFFDLMNVLDETNILWNDELEADSRANYVRSPQKHRLLSYDKY